MTTTMTSPITTTSMGKQALNADVNLRLPTGAPSSGEWTIRGAQREDVSAIKALFHKLHAFNASLDPRFAISDEWETHFAEAIDAALRGNEALCLITRDTGTNTPSGFTLAGIHHDSGMWRYHEWVEVEALYVEDAWRGRGLANTLLAHVYDWAQSVEQPVVQLYVTASNERAIGFYQREGFRVTQAIMRKVLA